ncbi:MAG: hypothetical protein ACHQPI_00335 [Thermoanaerobaculia bacterium]
MSPRRLRFLATLALAAGLVTLPQMASAASAVLSKNGTLYEVFPTTYGAATGAVADPNANFPILALRTTTSGGTPTVQVVDGTVDEDTEESASIEFEEETQTLVLVFTKQQSLYRGVTVALLQNGFWSSQQLLPGPGYTLAMNPEMVLSRQNYLDTSAPDPAAWVQKWRSIISVIWWEEGTLAQAKYAALFVEDGALIRDFTAGYNLNDLAGVWGPTSVAGLPPSTYRFPAVQRDFAGDGGVFVSFANLVTQRQTVASITFLSAPIAGPGIGGPIANSRHRPIFRTMGDGSLPGSSVAMAASLGTIISPSGTSTFWWIEGSTMMILPGTAANNAAPLSIPIRPDFSADKALAVAREMAEKQ